MVLRNLIFLRRMNRQEIFPQNRLKESEVGDVMLKTKIRKNQILVV